MAPPETEPYLARWRLVPDGQPIVTATARLLPVRQDGAAAILKLTDAPEERFGAGLMVWWGGDGAARVLAIDEGALLLERAQGPRSLIAMAAGGGDAEATAILCRVLARLHAPRPEPWPRAEPLAHRFRALAEAGRGHGGQLARSAEIARGLLAAPQDPRVLHGDIHHGNVLDFGPRGWLTIDPKRLAGERGFDYANIFCNPDAADPALAVARDPARFAARVALVAARSGIARERLLRWIAAWTGLSAVWQIADRADPGIPLAVGALALQALDGSVPAA